VHALLEGEFAKFPELLTAYHRHTRRREDARTERRCAEFRAADVVIAASNFTARSFARAGFDSAKVRVVPYGAPPPSSADSSRRSSASTHPLTLLWAGTFGVRKGAHYLIEAWRNENFGRHARLKVFGAVGLPGRFLRPIPPGVELLGSIPRGELMEQYRHADALLFPTLCDGFGMVATEAWSRGLPVITTDRAGAADLLRPNENGLLISAGNATAIAAAIAWCLDHRDQLRAMRESSLATAARWQWSDYRSALTIVLQSAGMFGPSQGLLGR
jgi:glycosyltransferase involved in cell wall biosynthesis